MYASRLGARVSVCCLLGRALQQTEFLELAQMLPSAENMNRRKVSFLNVPGFLDLDRKSVLRLVIRCHLRLGRARTLAKPLGACLLLHYAWL